jgi:hypothetical protein
MGTRDERIEDLFYVDLTADGNPTEEGQSRFVSGDVLAYLGGSVCSLTKIVVKDNGVVQGSVRSIDFDSNLTVNVVGDEVTVSAASVTGLTHPQVMSRISMRF